MQFSYSFGCAAACAAILFSVPHANGSLIVTGVIDGPLSGGLPKAIEVYATANIPDLSIYGLGSANNGGGSDGEEFTFPADSATAGEFLYVASESPGFTSFFGFAPDYTSGAANINGDDAIELFQNGSVIDVFGDINVDGTGEAWEHLDGWAYRSNDTGPDGTTFVSGNWGFSGVNALDGQSTNATATTPFPAGTYSTGGPVDLPPSISSLSPLDNAIEVAVDSNLTVTFNEPVQAGTGTITIYLSSNDSVVESVSVAAPNVSVAGSTLSLNPSADLFEGTSYYVELASGIVEDLTGNPFAGLSGSGSWNFTSVSGSLPPDIAYYTPVAGLTGNTLQVQLEQIIDDHTVIPYGSGGTGVWAAHADLYEDPGNSSNLILFYSQASIPKTLRDTGGSPDNHWNREHLWPQTYGTSSGAQYRDLFHLVPTYKGVNSSRSKLFFDYSNPSDGSFDDPADPLSPDCTKDSNSWEPNDPQKGWVARAMFYMITRYNFLTLVNSPPDPEPATNGTEMAQLSVLLEWNRKFLPALKEQEVNQAVFDNYQGNRNPYIDFPEFADAVHLTGPSWGGRRLEHFTFAELADPAISGDLADPDFDGIPNLVEMARYSDPRSADAEEAVEESVSGNQVTVTFIRATDMTHLNLVMEMQVSTDLLNWDPLPIGGATINTLSASQEELSVVRTVASGEAEFYRMKVTRP